MIKLNNTGNNIELQISVKCYQFPDDLEDDWCLIKAVVIQGNDKFEVTDPSLGATEVARILEWFKCLSLHKLPRFSKLSFTEPCLEFEFIACNDNNVRISVKLSHEMKPSYGIKQFNSQSNDWNIIFELCADDFKAIISNLEAALKQYPIRGKS